MRAVPSRAGAFSDISELYALPRQKGFLWGRTLVSAGTRPPHGVSLIFENLQSHGCTRLLVFFICNHKLTSLDLIEKWVSKEKKTSTGATSGFALP